MKTINIKLYNANTSHKYPDSQLVWSGTVDVPDRMIGYPDVILYKNDVFKFAWAKSERGHVVIRYRRARFAKVKEK